MSPRPVIAVALVLAAGFAVARTAPGDPRARVARAFLDSLDETQREQATFSFEDAERRSWNFLPGVYRGVRVKDLGEAQAAALNDLLAAYLSEHGRAKVRGIRWLEEVLFELESRPGSPATGRDPGLYFVAVFGTPGDRPWGWRMQGHHLSLNFTSDGAAGVAHAPLFLGVAPRVVSGTAHDGLEVLAREEGFARSLLASLDEERRARVVADAPLPRDVTMAPGQDAAPEARGLTGAEMTVPQRARLKALVDRFADLLAPDLARAEQARLADLDQVCFAWIGSTEAGQAHYWRVQGPRFVIEWDTPAGQPNHVHCVWRDLEDDFGADLLRAHRAAEADDGKERP